MALDLIETDDQLVECVTEFWGGLGNWFKRTLNKAKKGLAKLKGHAGRIARKVAAGAKKLYKKARNSKLGKKVAAAVKKHGAKILKVVKKLKNSKIGKKIRALAAKGKKIATYTAKKAKALIKKVVKHVKAKVAAARAAKGKKVQLEDQTDAEFLQQNLAEIADLDLDEDEELLMTAVTMEQPEDDLEEYMDQMNVEEPEEDDLEEEEEASDDEE